MRPYNSLTRFKAVCNLIAIVNRLFLTRSHKFTSVLPPVSTGSSYKGTSQSYSRDSRQEDAPRNKDHSRFYPKYKS